MATQSAAGVNCRIFFFVFQGKTLHHNATQGIIISNQSLVLQKVDRKNAGNYTCVGYNTEGDGESLPFYLDVMCTYFRRVRGDCSSEMQNISDRYR